ncbi:MULTISPECIES: glycosyltransferase family 87 protein [Rhodopseudomonas]|uniref:Membrane protein n=1 Tax=Rhodopseudomonas palustris TaxID=1076 RepID=A0A0D7DXM2_RHOPL|nr:MULTISPECIES: glycosyltransferase family 87 protein [Rhodopseudomonas]KIZ33333.1 membrane protein [Rhodopseudomonas palustris]MDF3814077.1 glycosyltransferase family 87 protein [Rhodopseudomonas sp. BAL398]WOK15762.1 glycosyltransferase family 87 protein [Rhodopseudomonas sp. BAL398]
MSKWVAALRGGDWVTPERIRLWALAVLVAALAGLCYLAATANGLSDFKGRPLGSDFSDIYAGGTYALDGTAGKAFDPPLQHAREQAIFGPDTPFYGWHYPPFLMFVAAPLATMPYLTALAVWQVSTLLLYLAMLLTVLRSVPIRPEAGAATLAQRKIWLLLALAFPAVFVNLGHGHNGFLTAALIGSALALLDRRPILAGVLFGLLSYKPQFGVMIPLVLMLSGRWRSFAAAAVTVLALALATTLAFGWEVWRAFIDSMPFTRHVVLEQGGTGWHKIQSVFAWVRMWGGSVDLAYLIQGAVTATLAVALGWLWRSKAAYPLQAAGLIIASTLATPYSLDYDFVALAPAIAFLAAYGVARGFAPWEKTALALLWLMPLVARSLAEQTLIPLGVPSMLLVFALLIRRAAADLGLIARAPALA